MMLCIGCMSEYVSHCVSLWKGRMLSHGWTPADVLGKGEKEGLEFEFCVGCGMELQGQASPRETPLMAVREAGQMGPRPFINTFQSTGIGTMMTLEAWVEGCERMWSGCVSRFRRGRKGKHTEHVAWTAVLAKEFLLFGEGLAQTDEQLCPALEPRHFVVGVRLQALGECLDGQLPETLLVDLVVVALVTREQPLQLAVSAKPNATMRYYSPA